MTARESPPCIFCQAVAGELATEKLFEDDEILAFRDLYPKAQVHALVIPKRHIATLNEFIAADSALLGRLMLVAKSLAADHALPGYRVIMNVNSEGGQVIFHAHLHLLGGADLPGFA
jgi:histidine triad (HIT) family protein